MSAPYYKPPIDPSVAKAAEAAKKKKKEIVVSSSSALELASELASLREKFDREKARVGKTRQQSQAEIAKRRKDGDILRGESGGGANKGVEERNARDLKWRAAQKRKTDGDGIREALEKKAKRYDAIKRGDFSGVNAADSALDIELISVHSSDDDDDDDDDQREDEHCGQRLAPEEDEMVEYTDEFGRTRMVSRYLLPKVAALDSEAQAAAAAKAARPANLIVGDVIQHDAFKLDEDEVRAIHEREEKERTEEQAVHYDASKEIRTKGVGFYNFSKDEDERAMEMVQLKNMRAETEKMVQESKEIRERWSRRRQERWRRVEKVSMENQGEKWLESFVGGGGSDQK